MLVSFTPLLATGEKMSPSRRILVIAEDGEAALVDHLLGVFTSDGADARALATADPQTWLPDLVVVTSRAAGRQAAMAIPGSRSAPPPRRLRGWKRT